MTKKRLSPKPDGTVEELPARPEGAAIDTRVVYGFGCTYWGGIDSIKVKWSGGYPMPCCPSCHGALMEAPTEEHYMAQVREYAKKTHDPAYVDFIVWMKHRRCLNRWYYVAGTDLIAILRVEFDAQQGMKLN